VKDASVSVQWFGVGCECRCLHCLLSSSGRLSTVPYEDAQGIAARFCEWRDSRQVSGLLVDFTVGYSYDFPCILDYVRFRRELAVPGSRSLALNGTRKRRDVELRQWLTDLREAGITEVGLSFYGNRHVHDEFANRPGDYDLLLQTARIASECNMDRSETIFLSAGTAGTLADLLNDLTPLPPATQWLVTPWDYRGRGKDLENRRATAADLAALPEALARCVDRDAYRTEGEWIRLTQDGLIPARSDRHYFVSVWQENLAQLQPTDCGEILAHLLSAEQALADALPSVKELADGYGDRKGQRIYALRDLEWKWQDGYLVEHPELGRSQRYDDLASGVRYKGSVES